MVIHYAHTVEGRPEDEWEPLEDHLRLVAEGDESFPGAQGFAAAFGAADAGRLLGLWHDMGKYSDEFFHYLKAAADADSHQAEVRGKVDHSTAGAQHAAKRFPGQLGRLLAYCIAGHHGGLPDARPTAAERGGLEDRLQKRVPPIPDAPRWLLDQPKPPIPQLDLDRTNRSRFAFQLAFFGRMLFSCLADADFLATEQFMQADRSAQRKTKLRSLQCLESTLNQYLDTKAAISADTPVNRRRGQILARCRKMAQRPPGLFSLTVPTGGGKTLSSLAFALAHARLHGLQRVIYAIPYTSIIEQNADVFREALSAARDGVVLEHHSSLEARKDTVWTRLASENWDAPVVVTTNVQLFESLFASKPSRCRKLHQMARSVIILDEAQSLPVELLRPTLAALDELRRNYDCTIVLCTATQPALTRREEFEIGLEGVEEIVGSQADVSSLFAALKRVDVKPVGPLDDAALVEQLAQEANRQVLCIVNTRKHAAELYQSLREALDAPEDKTGCIHLSAQMCARHRTAVLRLIRRRLRCGKPCRVISTQLIEAGVDVDFPVVYRADAGLDSVAQAAGRCNREGKLRDQAGEPVRGQVYLFEAEKPPPPGHLRQTADTGREVMPDHSRDLLAPAAIEQYFRLYFWKRKDEWDKHGVMGCFAPAGLEQGGIHLQYRAAAESYRLIREEQTPVVIPYGRRGRTLVERLKAMREPPGRGFDRLLQRYVVGLSRWAADEILNNHAAAIYHDRFVVAENPRAYDRQIGLKPDVAGFDPGVLMM